MRLSIAFTQALLLLLAFAHGGKGASRSVSFQITYYRASRLCISVEGKIQIVIYMSLVDTQKPRFEENGSVSIVGTPNLPFSDIPTVDMRFCLLVSDLEVAALSFRLPHYHPRWVLTL